MYELLEQQEILSRKINGKELTYHVYFLIHENSIVYVGYSENVYSRIKKHKSDKTFDSFTILDIKTKEEALALEQKYISKFVPKYNRYVNGFRYLSVDEVCLEYGIDESLVLELIGDEVENGKFRELYKSSVTDYLNREYRKTDEYKEKMNPLNYL